MFDLVGRIVNMAKAARPEQSIACCAGDLSKAHVAIESFVSAVVTWFVWLNESWNPVLEASIVGGIQVDLVGSLGYRFSYIPVVQKAVT